VENALQDEKLKALVARMDNLPSIPSLYVQMVEALHVLRSASRRLGAIIAKDMAMTAKILKLVNSAFFGLRRQVSLRYRSRELPRVGHYPITGAFHQCVLPIRVSALGPILHRGSLDFIV